MSEGLPSERFDPERHDTAAFACGAPGMDVWLREHAHDASRRNTAVTWVWNRGGRVVAYYSLSAHKVARDEVPHPIGRGGPVEIPAVMIGKLALDSTLHGQGLGGVLLADALTRVVAATQVVAARVVVVDALDADVARFYQRFGFTRVPEGLRLVRRISSVAIDLAGAAGE
ncbi:GNAT family N-acetyltransferase [Leifsonia shinshuensis]|uniref:GNAT family N-acetyltransferase n=1 Tax=Leifsonia shinshuensis TaxID=150026 RepID=UPI00285F49DA|nr:GNAT family N-acetyltransferase [Leifsonia shinshuensis]MDR6969932.1 putative GNAT family N-acyltransferase [Leifsonia shinshuensis]